MRTFFVCAHGCALLAIFAIAFPQRVVGQTIPSPGITSAVPPAQEEKLPAEPVPQILVAGWRTGYPIHLGEMAEGSSTMVRLEPRTRLPDFNRDIYYKNRLEYSLESGWLPVNIPFVFDFVVSSAYTTWPLKYTLQPNIASVRWELDNLWGWKFLRGNTDFSFSGAYTNIPRGAETRYFAFDYGIRRNFVPRRWRAAPYVEGRGGIGNINAKGPRGVEYAQGQDLTFTLMVGSGLRYNLNPKYSVAAGVTYMHISNFYLSEPRYENFGINVYGPIVGIYMRLGKPKHNVVY